MTADKEEIMEEKEVTRRAELAVEIALGSADVADAVRARLVRETATEIRRAYADGLTAATLGSLS